jgi:hypothetical protein
VTETEFAVSSSSTHRVFILSLEDNSMKDDRVTGTFFLLKNTITANIYLDGLQVYVLLLIHDTEHKEEGEICFNKTLLRHTSVVRYKTSRTHDFLIDGLKAAGQLPDRDTEIGRTNFLTCGLKAAGQLPNRGTERGGLTS